MGIPKLNKILIDKCSPDAICKIHLESLYKKKVAVDISIYLYRFLLDHNFMEHAYLFLSLFKYYCIEPIFVFDGKPPPEKHDTVKRRKMEKCAAKDEYDLLAKTIDDTKDNTDILKKMEVLKKKMVRVKWEHIDKVIELIQGFGFVHYMAPHEADQLCIHLAKRGDVYAVMSDDMDMVISGCARVIRSLNMSSHEATLYNNDQIIQELNLTLEHFRQIVILSGTDYDNKSSQVSIKQAFDLYYQYMNTNDDRVTFYDWLCSRQLVSDDFMTIYNLIEPDNYVAELDTFLEAAEQPQKKISVSTIKTIMTPYRFIFL